ncbi:hypothetical protein LCGC14_1340710 [marine sediment metagenome]|uniref:Uncharacterized protein n=1 Tax=marine sediment metagenome TaxID=412755 RepID=A0A0F9KEJ7_9ZZZZ
MEKKMERTLDEGEIKEAIEYWLSIKKGYDVKLHPGNVRIPMITIIRDLPPGGTSEPIRRIDIFAICELEIK